MWSISKLTLPSCRNLLKLGALTGKHRLQKPHWLPCRVSTSQPFFQIQKTQPCNSCRWGKSDPSPILSPTNPDPIYVQPLGNHPNNGGVYLHPSLHKGFPAQSRKSVPISKVGGIHPVIFQYFKLAQGICDPRI